MNKFLYKLLGCLFLSVSVMAKDANPPIKLTVQLRDGSRVVGTSLDEKLKFHSALLGDLKLPVADIRTVDFTATNVAKLKAANGDTLILEPAASSLALKTSFGKIELATDSIKKLSVTSSATAVPQRDGLIGFWSGNGNAADSVSGNDGVLVGEAGYGPGLVGQAFNVEPSGSYVKIPKSPALDPANAVTVEFWMKAAADNAMENYQGLVISDFYGVEISNGYGGTMGVNFLVSLNNGPRMRRFPAESDGFNGITAMANFTHTSDMNGGGAQVSAGQWHHVAGTFDGAQLRLYIDGQAWGQPVQRNGRIAPMLPQSFLCIGSEDGRTSCPDCIGNRHFKGSISNVAIYNRALTAAEIREDYEALKGE